MKFNVGVTMEQENKTKICISKKMGIGIFIVGFLIIQMSIEAIFGLKLLILGLNANFIRFILVLTLIMLPVFKENVNPNKAKRILRSIYTVLTILAVLFLIFMYMFIFSGNKYFYFKNPDKARTLVVEECSWLLSGGSNFYERKYGIFIKYTGDSILTDDGFRPFSNNAYNLKWTNDSTAQLNYDFGSGGYWSSEKITLP